MNLLLYLFSYLTNKKKQMKREYSLCLAYFQEYEMTKLNYLSVTSSSKTEGQQTLLKTNFGGKMFMFDPFLPAAKTGRSNFSFHNQGLVKPS